MSEVRSYEVSIPQSELDDLKTRLRLTRWPDKELVNDWSQGAPLHVVKQLCDYWQHQYDWLKCEQLLNAWPLFTVEIDGVDVFFVHVRSKHADATPMLLVHGWPGSVLEFRHIIEPLTDPEAHGGKPADAFHLVIPALPGYGFSSKPKDVGWEFTRTGRAFGELMSTLGYADSGWVAQGGDWGADIVAAMGHQAPKGLKAVHMNSIFLDVEKELQTPTHDSKGVETAKELVHVWSTQERGYFLQQSTKPQTTGYGLSDSPAALAAWIVEKMHGWSGKPNDLWSVFSMDEALDNIMLYWLTNSGTSSVRYYWEAVDDSTAWKIKLPVGVSWFPNDMSFGPREWCERYYDNIVHWREMERGGHFAAWEVPELLIKELREWHSKIK